MDIELRIAEALNDQVEAVGLVEPGDVLFEAEALDDLAGAGGEALDVVGEVGGDVVRIALKLLERIAAGVVERHAGDAAEDRIEVLDLAALELLHAGKDFILGRFKHAVQAAQDGQRKHDVLVLVGSVRAAQQVRH